MFASLSVHSTRGVFRLCETGCDVHVLYMGITTCYIFYHMLMGLKLSVGTCDVTISSDSHIHILNDVANIGMALILMREERWLA